MSTLFVCYDVNTIATVCQHFIYAFSYHYQWPLIRFSTFCQHSKSTPTVFLAYVYIFHHQHCNVSTLSVLQYFLTVLYVIYAFIFTSIFFSFWYQFPETHNPTLIFYYPLINICFLIFTNQHTGFINCHIFVY